MLSPLIFLTFFPSFVNCVSIASVATFKRSTSFHQDMEQDNHVDYDRFIYRVQMIEDIVFLSVQVSGRKAQKRDKFVLMLNGFTLRDCAHIRGFERQLSRQVGCNYRLNQFSAFCVRVREILCDW